MVPEMYRVRKPLRGVYLGNEKRIVLIPADSTITITSPPNGERLIPVVWRETTVHVFTTDFRERAVAIPGCQ